MKNKILIIIFMMSILSTLLITGCTSQNKLNDSFESNMMMDQDEGIMNEEDEMMESDVMMKTVSLDEDLSDVIIENHDSMMNEEYVGEVLAGKESLFLDFQEEDYTLALEENKIILLYFYANWCPSCKAEQEYAINAFNNLNRSDVIGFRVNYRDTQTSSFEKELAKKYGITYQHTKVILQNGNQVLKMPNIWYEENYLEEIAKITN